MVGFDQHLLQEAIRLGATLQPHMVTSVDFSPGKPKLYLADGRSEQYDLLVIASGLNSALLGLVQQTGCGFVRPVAAKSFVAEFKLGADAVERHLGNSMHVFLLDLPHLQFAALIPKGDFVTLVMLGDTVDEDLVNAFLSAEEVRRCFPDQHPPQNICQCFPRLSVSHARKPYADRLVFVGDSGVARLYKDGIGSAYRTAKAAANCVALYGCSATNFERHYWPACRKIVIDNLLGKFIFGVCHLIQKLPFARRAVLRMTEQEQNDPELTQHMSSVLWDVFTGSAPYKEVFLRTLHPVFICRLLWNLCAANLRFPAGKKSEVTAT
jgi:flavin-dependent dehydrogenase